MSLATHLIFYHVTPIFSAILYVCTCTYTIDFGISSPWRTVARANHVGEPSTSGNEKLSHIPSYHTIHRVSTFFSFFFSRVFLPPLFLFLFPSFLNSHPTKRRAEIRRSVSMSNRPMKTGFTSGRVKGWYVQDISVLEQRARNSDVNWRLAISFN